MKGIGLVLRARDKDKVQINIEISLLWPMEGKLNPGGNPRDKVKSL